MADVRAVVGGAVAAALLAGSAADPWREAYAHGIHENGLAGTPVEESVAAQLPGQVSTADQPAWLAPELLRGWTDDWYGYLMERTGPPGPDLAREQALLECLVDALRPGLPEGL